MKVKLNTPENGRGLRVRASCCLLLLSPVVVLIPCVCLCGRVCLGKNPLVFNAVVHADKEFQSFQTYHSLKFGASPSLCPDVFCTTADGGVFVGSSVLPETSTGGVEDSYPELAAGDDSDP